MTYALVWPRSGLITPKRSTARSPSAKLVAKMVEDVRMHLVTSYVVRERILRALEELDTVRKEASFQGWDGYGANPMSAEAYLCARRFLESLPTTMPPPEIGADPDGDVALDWSFGPRKTMSVSIGHNGRCSFAWMLGQSSFRGTDWFDDGIPRTIATALSDLARDAAQNNPRA
jgi:hypothetical protein